MGRGNAIIEQGAPTSQTSGWVAVFGTFSVQAAWSGIDTTDGKIHVEVSQDCANPTRLGSIAINSASNVGDADMFAVTSPFNYVRVVVENTATVGTIRVVV